MSAKKKVVLKKKDYSEDFKREAVLTYENSGKSKAEICRLLEISCGSLLSKWVVLYGSKRKEIKRVKSMEKAVSDKPIVPNSPENEKIIALEAEVKRLKQALGDHAVREYLAGLREESWREISPSSAVREVERLLAKKL